MFMPFMHSFGIIRLDFPTCRNAYPILSLCVGATPEVDEAMVVRWDICSSLSVHEMAPLQSQVLSAHSMMGKGRGEGKLGKLLPQVQYWHFNASSMFISCKFTCPVLSYLVLSCPCLGNVSL